MLSHKPHPTSITLSLLSNLETKTFHRKKQEKHINDLHFYDKIKSILYKLFCNPSNNEQMSLHLKDLIKMSEEICLSPGELSVSATSLNAVPGPTLVTAATSTV